VETLTASGFDVKPYHASVPSFGVWGFVLARTSPFDPPARPRADVELAYLNDKMFSSMFELPTDLSRPRHDIEINRLDNQALVRYYETEWRRFEH
jgi:spermidine synthase